MLVKIEARILIFPGTDFHFPSTSVPPGTFLGSGPLSVPYQLRSDVVAVLVLQAAGSSSRAEVRCPQSSVPLALVDRIQLVRVPRRQTAAAHRVVHLRTCTAPMNIRPRSSGAARIL